MKNICLILCVLLITAQAIGLPESFALSRDSGVSTRLTYLIVHGGWMHLLINIYAFLSLIFLCDMKLWQFAISTIIAITIPVFGGAPMVGFSTIIYAMTGIVVMDSNKWWWLVILNLLIIGAGMVMPGIAFLAHLYTFVIGAIVGFLTSKKHGREIA